jgi:hypothetical protein
MDGLIKLIQTLGTKDWQTRCRAAFDELYSAKGGRYTSRAEKVAAQRVPEIREGAGVPFGALIHQSIPPIQILGRTEE